MTAVTPAGRQPAALLPPTSSLPPLRSLLAQAEAPAQAGDEGGDGCRGTILAALRNLAAIYRPRLQLGSLPPAFHAHSRSPLDVAEGQTTSPAHQGPEGEAAGAAAVTDAAGNNDIDGDAAASAAPPPVLDSGYASVNEADEDEDEARGKGKGKGKGRDQNASSDREREYRAGNNAGEDEAEEEEEREEREEALRALRRDAFERQYAQRWLTGFLARADELPLAPPARDAALDAASALLSTLFAGDAGADDDEEGEAAAATAAEEEEARAEEYTRSFSFALSPSFAGSGSGSGRPKTIDVRLNDRLAGTNDSADHDDVGLQSWAAAIVFSELACADPARFGLVPSSSSSRQPRPPRRIVELGAGTGLVSLVLARLLPAIGVADPPPEVVATDYHPAVLENLARNAAVPASPGPSPPSASDRRPSPQEPEQLPQSPPGAAAVKTCLLDWAAPLSQADPALLAGGPIDMLVATDVVYAPEHATMLRDCAARLLMPRGGDGNKDDDNNDNNNNTDNSGGDRPSEPVFWLVITVRTTGKFEGIDGTVRRAFTAADCPRDGRGRAFTILEEEELAKRSGVGLDRRGEDGYRVFKIGWA